MLVYVNCAFACSAERAICPKNFLRRILRRFLTLICASSGIFLKARSSRRSLVFVLPCSRNVGLPPKPSSLLLPFPFLIKVPEEVSLYLHMHTLHAVSLYGQRYMQYSSNFFFDNGIHSGALLCYKRLFATM